MWIYCGMRDRIQENEGGRGLGVMDSERKKTTGNLGNQYEIKISFVFCLQYGG